MARYIAKNVVAARLADKCEIQLAYAIGFPQPVSVHVTTFGTGKIDDGKIEKAIRTNFDMSPAGIIKTLNLKRPIYRQTAAYGHFGRSEFPWEKTDKIKALQKFLK
jgi:S-adenosylmethionine synthetase